MTPVKAGSIPYIIFTLRYALHGCMTIVDQSIIFKRQRTANVSLDIVDRTRSLGLIPFSGHSRDDQSYISKNHRIPYGLSTIFILCDPSGGHICLIYHIRHVRVTSTLCPSHSPSLFYESIIASYCFESNVHHNA